MLPACPPKNIHYHNYRALLSGNRSVCSFWRWQLWKTICQTVCSSWCPMVHGTPRKNWLIRSAIAFPRPCIPSRSKATALIGDIFRVSNTNIGCSALSNQRAPNSIKFREKHGCILYPFSRFFKPVAFKVLRLLLRLLRQNTNYLDRMYNRW